MEQKEENILMIERINKEISELKISEVEDALSNNLPHDESINILICNKFNVLFELYEEIYSTNENLIINNPMLNNKMSNILSMINSPSGIELLDKNICSNYFAYKFYEEMQAKYKDNIGKIITLGFVPAQYGRIFKKESLEDSLDIERAIKIDQHIKLCHISTVLKKLSNTLKCINYNYLN